MNNKKKIKFRNESHLCSWCFEPLPKLLNFYCSTYCQKEAEVWRTGKFLENNYDPDNEYPV